MKQHIPQITFSATEKEIEDCLAYDCERFLGLKFIGRQISTPAGIVDVLAQSLEDKNVYYVIEVKKDLLDSKALCQVLRYSNYFNDNKNKDGQRIFVPLLVGANLSDDLIKSVYNFGYLAPELGRVEYTLFSLNVVSGMTFDYRNTAQAEYQSEHLNNCPSAYEVLNNDIDQLKYMLAVSKNREGNKNGQS